MNTNTQTTVYNPGQPSNIEPETSSKQKDYFNNFFVKTAPISVQANDAIVSYFQEQTGSKESAKILVQAVLNTAAQQGDDPLKVLDEFRKMPIGELNAFLTMYLNASRVNTSLLGIRQTLPTNKYVVRTILP
jgi:hypothetical protein